MKTLFIWLHYVLLHSYANISNIISKFISICIITDRLTNTKDLNLDKTKFRRRKMKYLISIFFMKIKILQRNKRNKVDFVGFRTCFISTKVFNKDQNLVSFIYLASLLQLNFPWTQIVCPHFFTSLLLFYWNGKISTRPINLLIAILNGPC